MFGYIFHPIRSWQRVTCNRIHFETRTQEVKLWKVDLGVVQVLLVSLVGEVTVDEGCISMACVVVTLVGV